MKDNVLFKFNGNIKDTGSEIEVKLVKIDGARLDAPDIYVPHQLTINIIDNVSEDIAKIYNSMHVLDHYQIEDMLHRLNIYKGLIEKGVDASTSLYFSKEDDIDISIQYDTKGLRLDIFDQYLQYQIRGINNISIDVQSESK